MNKEREEFEKLPEISDLVEHFDFSDDTNTYHIRYDDMDDDIKRLDVVYLGGAWYAWQAAKAQAVPEGYVLASKEPSADLVAHGHQVFLGHFNEGGQTGGRSIYFAYKAMIEAQESAND